MSRLKALLLNALVTTLTVTACYGAWRASIQWRRVDAMWAWVNAQAAQQAQPMPTPLPLPTPEAKAK